MAKAAGVEPPKLEQSRRVTWGSLVIVVILVNTFVSLFAGFIPVPGGVGVAEAAYTAGLVAIGIPDTAALSTTLIYRLVTFYLPPLWGAPAMRWLRRHSYL